MTTDDTTHQPTGEASNPQGPLVDSTLGDDLRKAAEGADGYGPVVAIVLRQAAARADVLTAALREARDAAGGMAVAYEHARKAQVEAEAEVERLRAMRETCYSDECGEPCQSWQHMMRAELSMARAQAGKAGRRLGEARAERDRLRAFADDVLAKAADDPYGADVLHLAAKHGIDHA